MKELQTYLNEIKNHFEDEITRCENIMQSEKTFSKDVFYIFVSAVDNLTLTEHILEKVNELSESRENNN